MLCLLLFFACQQKIIPVAVAKVSPSAIIIESLQVLNLSENMSIVSTQSDEVVFNFFLLEQLDEKIETLDHYYSPSFTFDRNGQEQFIQDTLSFSSKRKENLIAVFTLTELDKEDSVLEVQEILKKELLNGQFLKKVDPLRIDSLLGFDDFLGMHYFKFKQLEKGKKIDLEFKGRQMFDKFEYRLKGSWF